MRKYLLLLRRRRAIRRLDLLLDNRFFHLFDSLIKHGFHLRVLEFCE